MLYMCVHVLTHMSKLYTPPWKLYTLPPPPKAVPLPLKNGPGGGAHVGPGLMVVDSSSRRFLP